MLTTIFSPFFTSKKCVPQSVQAIQSLRNKGGGGVFVIADSLEDTLWLSASRSTSSISGGEIIGGRPHYATNPYVCMWWLQEESFQLQPLKGVA